MPKEFTTGQGKYGVKIVHPDGDIEYAYCTSKKDRDILFKNMKPLVRSITKLKVKK